MTDKRKLKFFLLYCFIRHLRSRRGTCYVILCVIDKSKPTLERRRTAAFGDREVESMEKAGEEDKNLFPRDGLSNAHSLSCKQQQNNNCLKEIQERNKYRVEF